MPHWQKKIFTNIWTILAEIFLPKKMKTYLSRFYENDNLRKPISNILSKNMGNIGLQTSSIFLQFSNKKDFLAAVLKKAFHCKMSVKKLCGHIIAKQNFWKQTFDDSGDLILPECKLQELTVSFSSQTTRKQYRKT